MAMRPASSLLLKTTMSLMVILKGKQSLTLNPMADSQKMNVQRHLIFSYPTGTLPKHTWSSRLIKWYWAKCHSLRWSLEGLSQDLCEHHIHTAGTTWCSTYNPHYRNIMKFRCSKIRHSPLYDIIANLIDGTQATGMNVFHASQPSVNKSLYDDNSPPPQPQHWTFTASNLHQCAEGHRCHNKARYQSLVLVTHIKIEVFQCRSHQAWVPQFTTHQRPHLSCIKKAPLYALLEYCCLVQQFAGSNAYGETLHQYYLFSCFFCILTLLVFLASLTGLVLVGCRKACSIFWLGAQFLWRVSGTGCIGII